MPQNEDQPLNNVACGDPVESGCAPPAPIARKAATMNNAPIKAAPVIRDECGQWRHPGIPEFDEGQEEEYRNWLVAQGIEIAYKMLESEPEHPLYDAWFDHGEHNMTSWTPEQPEGEGWFTISIHDTEDGPMWVWARRTTSTDSEKGGAA